MRIARLICMFILVAVVSLAALACAQPSAEPREESRKIAEEFVKKEATFQFDGIPDTFMVMSTTAAGDGWKYIIGYDSRHAGYGNRSGEALAAVVTHHTAEIMVLDGSVTTAIMDGQWDMINQRTNVEIKPAPIEKVKVNILKSNPPRIGVHIKGGLADGCTTFHAIEIARNGSAIDIEVTVQRPVGVSCPAIYTHFEKDIDLGSDFASGTTYTLNVNDYSTTFAGTLMENEGFAIYLTRDDIPPGKMAMLSHVEIADEPIVSLQDIITYDAQTHELELTENAFNRIANLEVSVHGKSFLVCVDRAPIYWGAFWVGFSSQSFDGVTIWKPLGVRESRVIAIELGYPGASFYQGEDPRNNPAVLHSLEQSGKLIHKLSIASTEKLPRSFKGYELYSWEEGSQWHFSLITGTNRTKTFEEITSEENIFSENGWVKIHVVGTDAIKDVLSRLPAGEPVCWCGELHIGQAAETDFRLPPVETVKTLKEHAARCGLNFTVTAQAY